MAEMAEVAALRAKVAELQAENARFKATRAAFVKLYNSSRGAHNPNRIYTRERVYDALMISTNEDERLETPGVGKFKPEWEVKIKRVLFRPDGTLPPKAERMSISAVTRAVQKEVLDEGDEFDMSESKFRVHVERVIYDAETAEAAALLAERLAQANLGET